MAMLRINIFAQGEWGFCGVCKLGFCGPETLMYAFFAQKSGMCSMWESALGA